MRISKKIQAFFLFTVAGGGGVGCALETDGTGPVGGQLTAEEQSGGTSAELDADVEEFEVTDVEVAATALSAGWVSGPYLVAQGLTEDVRMQPASTHLCVLTRIQGRFHGSAELIQVYRSGGYWNLRLRSRQDGLVGEAYCFRKSEILTNGATVAQADFGVGISGQSGCRSSSTNAYLGDATSFINAFQGKLQGGCEYVEVLQSGSPFVNSTARAGTGQSQLTSGTIHSFFKGTPQVQPAKFYRSTPTVLSANNTSRSAALAPVNDAICHLVKIQGDFNGGGERIQIYPSGGRWYLSVTEGSGSGPGITGAARCYLRDQR